MNRLASQIVIDILTAEMLLDDQTIWIRDQNKVIPGDNGLYIELGPTYYRTTSNTTELQQVIDPVTNQPKQQEVNTVQAEERIQIDIWSRTPTALMRNWEVIAALNSFRAQQEQEENYFKIMKVPASMINTSILEGGSYINRYTVSIECLVWYRKIKDMPTGDYYDDFHTRVDDEATIGTDTPMVAFEINSTGIVK